MGKKKELKLFIDGDQYCVLYGSNLQEGIAGFGDTEIGAIRNFYKEFLKVEQTWFKCSKCSCLSIETIEVCKNCKDKTSLI